jgi:carbon-monoxide dehydrogenase large subunit
MTMNTATDLKTPAPRAGTEVEERPQTRHEDQPLPPVTEDPRYIGASSERPSARKLVQGQGTYIDDIELPRMAHVVYWRSPLAHAKVLRIHADEARRMPGVILVADGHDLTAYCKPWVATLAHLAGMKSAPQYPMALDRVWWRWWPKRANRPKTPCSSLMWSSRSCRPWWTWKPPWTRPRH